MESPPMRMKLRVCVRLRPVSGSTSPSGPQAGAPDTAAPEDGIVQPEYKLLYLKDPLRGHSSEFVFDRVFDASTTQDALFQEVGQPMIEHVLHGYNACCFAYGQTGSGKTYTMFGKEGASDWASRGVIPRAAELLFSASQQLASSGGVRLAFFVSFLEIYLEQVRDLGQAAKSAVEAGGARGSSGSSAVVYGSSGSGGGIPEPPARDVLEDASGMTFVKDLTYIEVQNLDDVLAVLRAGSALRQTAATGQSDVSSRSHTVFTLSVVQYRDDGSTPITGRLNLVDLAGSERLSKSNSEGQRLKETKSINTSLTALGKVVLSLSQEGALSGHGHIPFRDSKLTRILKDSLLGNSVTTLLANLHPTPDNFDECFATLTFALRCSSINLAPHVNVLTSGGPKDALMEQLVRQVAGLKEELEATHAHYQKLLESVAGPAWAQDLGPVERTMETHGPPGGSGSGIVGSGSGGHGVGERASSALQGGSGGDGGRHVGAASVAFASAGGGAGAAAGGRASHPPRSAQPVDQRMKRLEVQLEGQRAVMEQYESRLAAKQSELEGVRERALGKEHNQFQEIKRLRQQIQELQRSVSEKEIEAHNRLLQEQRKAEEDCARLQRDVDTLRGQLAQVTGSVGAMMENSSAKVAAERRAVAAHKDRMEKQAKSNADTVLLERQRQVDNIKQQSTYFLARQAEQAEQLRQALGDAKEQAAKEAEALRQECALLADYAAKVTEIVRRMESGVIPVQDRAGIKAFKLQPHDRPRPIDPARLHYLRSRADMAEQLLALTITPQQQQGSSSQRGATTPGGTQQAWSGSGAAPDLAALRAEWEAQTRASVAQQVMADMRSDRTVEYIRSLEEQLAKYRTEVQVEKKRCADMSVALRSVQRAGTQPESPLARVLSGGSLQKSPTWGPGHGNGLLLSGSSSPKLRPSTAAASFGGYGGGAAGGGVRLGTRPGTAIAHLSGGSLAGSLTDRSVRA